MTRARSSGNANVSMFPFLAVLLCTMGALVVILVVLVSHTRSQASQKALQADTVAVEAAAAAQTQHQHRKEDLEWEIENMQASMQATDAKLQDDRLRLSGIEDHLHRLKEQFRTLSREADLLAQSQQLSSNEFSQRQARLAQLQNQITAASVDLERAREEAANRKPSYSIIPYEGRNGTRRRPLYIECRSDAVVLQPEGVLLTADDFDGPLGPGNPLAAALRAAREYVTAGGADSDSEPYPLLLVRPGGIAAYYMARKAIQSWGENFGYELIDDDWQLEFQQPDSQLAHREQEAVRLGRIHQARLIAAAPGQYGRGRPGFQASGQGGFVAEHSQQPAGTYRPGGSEGDFRPGSGTTGSASATTAQQVGPTLSPPSGNETPQTGEPQQTFSEPQPQRRQFQLESSGSGQPGGTSAQGGQQHPSGQRGRNWGLPGGGRGSTPITRPIQVVVEAQRVLIISDQRGGQAREVALEDNTANSIDALVSTIWDHMDGWGIAGNGLHWKPILKVHVGSQGIVRAAELQQLLHGSGIDIEPARPTNQP